MQIVSTFADPPVCWSTWERSLCCLASTTGSVTQLRRRANMATVRQVDTALWLHNKLSSDDPWSGSSLRSLLTPDVLRNIPECFHRLETQVKIKLLTAFLHIPRRVVDETSVELGDILEIGSQDEDEWVRVLCEILRDFPTSGMLNVHLEGASPVFAEVCQEIRNTCECDKGQDIRADYRIVSHHNHHHDHHTTMSIIIMVIVLLLLFSNNYYKQHIQYTLHIYLLYWLYIC